MPTADGKCRVGVLALQGSVVEHLDRLKQCGAEAEAVKTLPGLMEVDGLIIPGGESTTMGKLLKAFGLLDPLKKRIREGLPVWGTCAGLILLAQTVIGGEMPRPGTMAITVRRNAYGTQLDSFETSGIIPAVSPEPLPLVFIRAPYIEAVGPEVTVLHQLDGHITAACQDRMLVTAFHPELTEDCRVHRFFIDRFVTPGSRKAEGAA